MRVTTPRILQSPEVLPTSVTATWCGSFGTFSWARSCRYNSCCRDFSVVVTGA
jgi:hypothetical protein